MVSKVLLLSSLWLLIHCASAVKNADEDEEEPVVVYPRCFRFTWPGPFQYKKQIADMSCQDLREDYNNVPCRNPIAPTDNDREPDMYDLWLNYKDKPNAFDCPMVPGQACVKYVYTYNQGVQNITYMCAKVNATDGCYRQKYISGLEVEMCVCHSQEDMMPCNFVYRLFSFNRINCILMICLALQLFFRLHCNEKN